MENKIAFLVDDRCDRTSAGLIINWVHNKLKGTAEVKAIYANVHRWFYENVYSVCWLTPSQIIDETGTQESALQISIEHIRQLCVTPWPRLRAAIKAGAVGFDGKWCGLCVYHKAGEVESIDCVLNSRCRGDCCEEWQVASAALGSALQHHVHPKRFKQEQYAAREFEKAVAVLFAELVAAQLGGAEILMLVSDCWEELYKMRTSIYIAAAMGKYQPYVCGVSLSEIEVPLSELPNFTVHAPGVDFKGGLLFDIDRVLSEREKDKDGRATINTANDKGNCESAT